MFCQLPRGALGITRRHEQRVAIVGHQLEILHWLGYALNGCLVKVGAALAGLRPLRGPERGSSQNRPPPLRSRPCLPAEVSP